MAGPIRIGIAGFPAAQFEAALQRWPALAAGWETRDYSTYCRMLEQTMTGLAGEAIPVLAPITITALEEWAASRHLDPGSREARSQYAADLACRFGPIGPIWPPGPTEDCWCGSGHPYRSCCRTGDAFHRPTTR